MKIICIGRNYADHAKELGNEAPKEPVVFMKPDSAILLKNSPFFIPDFSKEIHHEIELVVKIDRLGKNIHEKFAHKYFNEVSIGIDFTARDVQNELRAKGLPWEKAKSFDGSAFVPTKWINKSELPPLDELNFSLEINGDTRQKGNSKEMIFNIHQLIAFVSKYYTLKIGDLIFTGTPAGVGKVEIGDVLTGKLLNEKIFDLKIK